VLPESVIRGAADWQVNTASKEQQIPSAMRSPEIIRSLTSDGPGKEMAGLRLDLVAASDKKLEDTLSELHFLVEDDRDEWKDLDRFLAEGYQPKTFCPVIAVTASCNLDCIYCFEEGAVDRRDRISSTNSGKVVQWLEDYVIKNSELERLSLGLFGGEPLLYPQACEYFIREANSVADRHNLSFDFGITTNGTRLSRDLVIDWRQKGLSFIRVTLDGPKKIHDERRPFRGKKKSGSFDLILQNLKSISDLEGFEIEIEINVDNENYKYVPELLDILADNGLRDRISVVPEQTFESLASAGKATGCGAGACGSCSLEKEHKASDNFQAKIGESKEWFSKFLLKENDLSEAFVFAVSAIGQKKFRMPEMVGVYYPCIFVQKHHVVIDWSGDLYKCSFTMGNSEMRAGDVVQGFNENNERMLASVSTVEWCKERRCAYIPLCGGGCRYEAFNSSGSYEVPNCKAELIDAVLPKTVPYFFGLDPATTSRT